MPHTVGGPVPTGARQGRERQRYGKAGERLVAGCIPFQMLKKLDGMCEARILMITSRNGKGFVFPKGGWEEDESVECAALRETVEEAGVRGRLEEPFLGTFNFKSGKVDQQTRARGNCVAYMFSMEVFEELDCWPEHNERTRIWCTLGEAYVKARHDWMRSVLLEWAARKGLRDQLVESLRRSANGFNWDTDASPASDINPHFKSPVTAQS